MPADPTIINPVKLGFNPETTKDKELRAVIADPLAWLFWRCWRPRHMTGEHFNEVCIVIANKIRERKPTNAEELARCIPCSGNGDFTKTDIDPFVVEFWPYYTGASVLVTLLPE